MTKKQKFIDLLIHAYDNDNDDDGDGQETKIISIKIAMLFKFNVCYRKKNYSWKFFFSV